MVNRSYNKGAANERQIINRFRAQGCYATRSAGSKSVYDIVVVDGNILRLIQVKSKKMNLIALDLPDELKISQELWWKEKGKWKVKVLEKNKR